MKGGEIGEKRIGGMERGGLCGKGLREGSKEGD